MSLESSVCKISGGRYKSSVDLPYSKSYANRLLILGAISPDLFEITNIALSSDVITLIEILKEIGLDIRTEHNKITIHNNFPACEKLTDQTVQLETKDGGTTNRFLACLLLLGKNRYELVSTHKFKERPNDEFIKQLNQLGIEYKTPEKNDRFWTQIKGPLKAKKNTLEIDCSETTQFYTGFKLLESETSLKVRSLNLNTSQGYASITDKIITDYKTGTRRFEIPIDFSSASYPIVFGSINHDLIINNCVEIDRSQPDSVLIELINSIGGSVKITKKGLEVEKSELSSFDIDCSGCPDLVPALAYLACHINGVSKIRHIEVLRHKESDRVEAILSVIFEASGKADYNESEDILTISGPIVINKEINFQLPPDHRMIMLASLLLRSSETSGSVDNATHVKKSYPDFFRDLLDK